MSNQSSRGREWNRVRLSILERDGYVCAYGCGREADTVDHVVPKDLGGTDDESNLVAACRKCNGIKSNKTLVAINYVNKRWLESL